MRPEERQRYLEIKCGSDAELRAEVESLLAHGEMTDQGVRQVLGMAAEALPEVGAPAWIGPWRVIRELGHGGMGTVYLTERTGDGFRQLAATKLVRRGMDTELMLSRFRYERRILANLTHENIARLYDGGTTVDGQPYFAMEYVEGQPVTAWCQGRGLKVPEKLRLFQQICRAVEHAHRNLVVHRDLKPSHVLVSGEGVPKLLDFGIAKLLDPAQAEELTVAAGMMTPEYASPEQVRGETVTTATDVYSLGAILYELLTGAKAHQFTTRTPTEFVKVVCETDPPHDPRIPGDLENIVRKAMQKEPARRYTSARELNEDIANFLAGRPVKARADSAGYRVRKFVLRHWLVVVACSAILLSLIAGAVATAYEYRIAKEEARRAERRFDEVRKLANRFLFDFDNEVARLPGSTKAREMVAATAMEYLDRLAQDSEGDPGLKLELAIAYEKTGNVLGEPGAPSLGRVPEAAASYEKAAAILSGLVSADKANVKARQYLVDAHMTLQRLYGRMGKPELAMQQAEAAGAFAKDLPPDSADSIIRRARAELALGHMTLQRQKLGLAAEHYGKSAELAETAERLAGRHYSVLLGAYGGLGKVLEERGELIQAKDTYGKLLALTQARSREQPGDQYRIAEVMRAYEYLGIVTGDPVGPNLGDPAAARSSFEKAVAIAREMQRRDPRDVEAEISLAVETLKLAEMDLEAAPRRSIQNSLASLAEADRLPETALKQLGMATIHVRLARAYMNLGDTARAKASLGQAERFARNGVSGGVEVSDADSILADNSLVAGDLARSLGHAKQAEGSYLESLAYYQKMYAQRPESLGLAFGLSEVLERLAGVSGELQRATEFHRRQVVLWRDWAGKRPKSSFSERQLRNAEALLVSPRSRP